VVIGIAICVSQSAMFSGLNLALFGLSRLRLEVEVAAGHPGAKRVLALRRDSNYLLATILWRNVAANCLLTLLSDSVLTGLSAFLFSTILITCVGEIMPQAYFSRNALRMAERLEPLIRFYQLALYPVTRPTGRLLDWWLGREGVSFFREAGLREVIRRHVVSEVTDLDHVEGRGALNFMDLDDLPAGEEGEPLDPLSVIRLPVSGDQPLFPEFERSPDDPFVKQLLASGHKWAVIVDPDERPRLVLDADGFARGLMKEGHPFDPRHYTTRPIIVEDPATPLGQVLDKFCIVPESPQDDVIDHDVILVWGAQRRIITGADLLGRLFRGITKRLPSNRW
jgi:metal transporter CNNM